MLAIFFHLIGFIEKENGLENWIDINELTDLVK
jgi:hypothetical protein